MPKEKKQNVVWSNNSLKQAIEIKKYISKNFTDKEVNSFYSLLESFENAIKVFSELYPKSNKKSNLRRAVISREMTAIYRINKQSIEIIALFDNRCDWTNWI